MTPPGWGYVVREMSEAYDRGATLTEYHWAPILRRQQEECWALETAALISAALSSEGAPPETIKGDSPT